MPDCIETYSSDDVTIGSVFYQWARLMSSARRGHYTLGV